MHNLEEPEAVVYPGYDAVCGRDCFTTNCGISPHDFDDVIDDEKNDNEEIDEGETELDLRNVEAGNKTSEIP